jgi:chemotaxis protein histidine kinase CheA
MALEGLKTYGLKFKDLKAVCKSLNDADITDTISVKVGVKGVDMLQAFLEAVEATPKVSIDEIPDDVREFYDDLPQQVFDDADPDSEEEEVEETEEEEVESEEETEAEDEESEEEEVEESEEVEETEEEEVESDCPTFATGWNPKEKDCKACKKDTPEEYKTCKTLSKKAKKKAKKKTKKGTRKGRKGTRTRYGHMPGMMAGAIDDMVYEGTTADDMIKFLMKNFDKTEAQAKNKVAAHISYLEKKVGISIKKNKKGVLKAKEEFAQGFNAETTVTWDGKPVK